MSFLEYENNKIIKSIKYANIQTVNIKLKQV